MAVETPSTEVSADLCLRLARRGGAWIAGELLHDKSKEFPFGDWFKAPFALAQCGDTFAGNAILNQILKKFGGGPESPGVFEPRKAASDMSFRNIMYCYRQAVCLTGAAALGRWDVASLAATAAAVECRQRWKGHSDRMFSGWGHAGIVSAGPTAMMGMYLLHRNQLEVACEAGDFLVHMFQEGQSDAISAQALFCYWDVERGALMTDAHIQAHEQLEWFRGRRVLFCVDARLERQHNWVPGLVAAFLAELAASTGQDKYQEAAWFLLEYDQSCRVLPHWPSHCKAAWGAANIITFAPPSERKSKRWLAVEAHMKHVAAHAFVANFQESGSFGTYHFPLHDRAVTGVRNGLLHYANEEGIEPGTHMILGTAHNLTAEFVYELCMVARALATSEEVTDDGRTGKRLRTA